MQIARPRDIQPLAAFRTKAFVGQYLHLSGAVSTNMWLLYYEARLVAFRLLYPTPVGSGGPQVNH